MFRSSVVGSIPGQTAGGVASGGAPWVVERGEARIGAHGRLRVEVRGLLLLNGTTGPITAVRASLVCGGSGGTVVATTDAAPLSPAGDAKIEEKITLPQTCFAPAVLVRVGGTTTNPPPILGAWIAITGFTNSPEQPSGEDSDSKDQDDR